MTDIRGALGVPKADRRAWRRAAAATVLGSSVGAVDEETVNQAMATLRTVTDELVFEPLYAGPGGPLGYPGVMPFTRGSSVPTGAVRPWQLVALHADPDVDLTARAIADDIADGASALWFRTGRDAVPPAALRALLDGVAVPVSVASSEDQDAAAAALLDAVREPALSGSLGIDGLALAVHTGESPDLSRHAHWVDTCLRDRPGVRALTVDILPYQDAGASSVQLLAYAVATGVAYLRELEESGIAPEQACGQLMFRVPADADQFLTIARLRALRRLWARVAEVSGVSEAERGARQHAVASRSMYRATSPLTNLLRGTVACFAAAAGSAEEITVLPHDSALQLPDTFSRRLARNIQLLVAEEANIGRVADPAGGSWYAEELTDQLARLAWAEAQRIEAAGGMVAAWTSGQISDGIAAGVAERAAAGASR